MSYRTYRTWLLSATGYRMLSVDEMFVYYLLCGVLTDYTHYCVHTTILDHWRLSECCAAVLSFAV